MMEKFVTSAKTIFRTETLKPLFVVNTLFTLANFSGFIVVIFYGVTIFQVCLYFPILYRTTVFVLRNKSSFSLHVNSRQTRHNPTGVSIGRGGVMRYDGSSPGTRAPIVMCHRETCHACCSSLSLVNKSELKRAILSIHAGMCVQLIAECSVVPGRTLCKMPARLEKNCVGGIQRIQLMEDRTLQ